MKRTSSKIERSLATVKHLRISGKCCISALPWAQDNSLSDQSLPGNAARAIPRTLRDPAKSSIGGCYATWITGSFGSAAGLAMGGGAELGARLTNVCGRSDYGRGMSKWFQWELYAHRSEWHDVSAERRHGQAQ